MQTLKADYDLCVIGGGINGAGIAREAAGRGLSVLLVEARDLAQGTSSASTKLIHGGLRYLELYEFKLVRESLKEREVLLGIAPHIIHPLKFILPHVKGVRPKWMIGMGLWLYDHIGGRKVLPKSGAVSFHDSFIGQPLKDEYTDGFFYADCWADDSRLVALNVVDAKAKGAEVLTRTVCLKMERLPDTSFWHVHLKDLKRGDEFQISAAKVVNAAGPWVRGILDVSNLASDHTPKVRLVKGSHMMVPKLFDGEHAFLLQQPDKRIVFAIPYEGKYTLIGTTDEPFEGDAAAPVISDAEKDYLCAAVNRFFDKQITPADAPWTYSGVRALFDDGEASARKITRDYKLDLDEKHGAPLLSVFGGKLTTYRMLAVQAVDRLFGKSKKSGWTAKVALPGGNIAKGDRNAYEDNAILRYDFLPEELVRRYVRAYGTRIDVILDGVDSVRGMGRDFGGGLYEKEVFYLINHEFSRSAEDILWRRSKLGLHLEKKSMLALDSAMPDYLKASGV